MLINTIYAIIFLILAYVIFIAVHSVKRILKNNQNKKHNLNKASYEDKKKYDIEEKNKNFILLNEIDQLKKFHSEGVLNDEEFKKAKEKILKSLS